MQAILSLQVAPVLGVEVQVAVPLQARVLQVSLVQVTAVPAQTPDELQTSVCVQAMLSLQGSPVLGVEVQVAVPLQARVLQVSLAQVMAVPPQAPAVQTSVCVHIIPSLQVVPSVAFG